MLLAMQGCSVGDLSCNLPSAFMLNLGEVLPPGQAMALLFSRRCLLPATWALRSEPQPSAPLCCVASHKCRLINIVALLSKPGDQSLVKCTFHVVSTLKLCCIMVLICYFWPPYSDPGASSDWQHAKCSPCCQSNESCRLVNRHACQHLLHIAGDWFSSLSFAKCDILSTT